MPHESQIHKKDSKKQNRKSNLLVIILVILIILFITIIVIGKIFTNNKLDTNENKTTGTVDKVNEDIIYNNNDKVVEDKTIGDITFTNIKCSFDGNYSLLEYTVTNNGQNSIKLGEYEFIVKDKQNNIIAILASSVDYELKSGESYQTGNAIDSDLSNAYAIELQKND